MGTTCINVYRTIQQQQDDSITKKDEIELTIILENTRDSYLEKFDQIVEQTIQIGKQINDNVLTRQAAPKVYDLNASFYFYKRLFFF